MRVTEIMADFRNLQTYIANMRASPSAEDYNEEGYVILRRCVAEARALLAHPFQTTTKARDEAEKEQLQRCRVCDT